MTAEQRKSMRAWIRAWMGDWVDNPLPPDSRAPATRYEPIRRYPLPPRHVVREARVRLAYCRFRQVTGFGASNLINAPVDLLIDMVQHHWSPTSKVARILCDLEIVLADAGRRFGRVTTASQRSRIWRLNHER